MGCSAYGPVSSEFLRATAGWDFTLIETFGMTLFDLRPSELEDLVPEWADRDWWRQRIIDQMAREAGELTKEPYIQLGKPWWYHFPWRTCCGGCGWPIQWAWHDTVAGQMCRNCQLQLSSGQG